MNRLTHFAIKNARFTWLIIVALVLGGVSVFLAQPRQEDPEITLRSAQVVTRFPGLSPERIEQLISRPIEDAVKTISEIEKIKSISMTGLSIVAPEVKSQYTDMAPIWADLRNKMEDLKSQLPDGAIGPQVNDDYGRVAVVTLALNGKEFSLSELYSVSKDVRDELNALPLVARVDLFGVQPERIWIEFDPAFMAQFGLDPTEIVNALQRQNVILPGGVVEAAGSNIVIEPSGDFQSVDDIRKVAIDAGDGQTVYLEDLANIRRGYASPPQAPAFYNNQPAIVLGVSMVEKSNVVELGHQVKESLRKINLTLPLGMNLDVAIFQPDLVQESVSNATENLLQTVFVVLVVVMLTLGLRAGIIVGAMVPLTMLATLIGMSIWGIELHRVSIAAIIVALGLLVDNGVVIAEDIKKRFDHGVDRLEAVLATVNTLAIPLLTSSLTTVAAFTPLMLITGGSGEFLISLGQVLSLALLTSWLIAITIVPAFCFWFFPHNVPQDVSTEKNTKDETVEYNLGFYKVYKRGLLFVLRRRVLFVVLMFALLLSSTYVFKFIKQRSLGPSERNQFVVYLDLPAESSMTQTLYVTNRLSRFLIDKEKNPEVMNALAYVGTGGPRFFLSLAPNDAQPNKAFLVVNTERSDQIKQVMAKVERFIIEEIPEASGRADILFLGKSPLGTLELLIKGDDINKLRQLASKVKDAFYEVPGVVSVRNDWENAVLKLSVDVDQERARRAGVTSEEISRTLSAYFDGIQVTTYREGELSIPVSLRASSESRATLDRVRSVEVLSTVHNVPVPLTQVADFYGQVEPSKIKRIDQVRAVTISGKHPEMTSLEFYKLIKSKLDEIQLQDNYSLEVSGEIKDSEDSNKDLFRYAPHALFAILVLLVLQFNSFRRPAIILLTIPLVLIGANYGLLLFRGYFDFTAMLGLFSLAGIIINNGIVLIDRIDQGRDEGLDVDQAIVVAAIERARPIIMTTVTTVVGLIPLALFGGEFWYGMAIVIMCGLGVGSVLTLGFVPVIYSLLFAFRSNKNVEASSNADSLSIGNSV